MEKISSKKINLVKETIKKNQKKSFPYTIHVFGINLEIHENVFPVGKGLSSEWMVQNMPAMSDETVLEIGCGTGIIALYLAKNGAKCVTATDINSCAIHNTQVNIERNNIKNVEVFESDVFSAINTGTTFDTIFWIIPSTLVSNKHKFQSLLERGSFDPGRRLLHQFLAEGPSYLNAGGRMILGCNVATGATPIENAIVIHELSWKLLAESKKCVDKMRHYRLYELRPKW